MDQYDREKFIQYSKMKPWQSSPNIHIETRKLVEKLQNISIASQLAIEKRVSSMRLEPFSLPELDFPPALVNNMSRCHSEIQTVRQYNALMRAFIVDEMKAIVIRDLEWKRHSLTSMLEQLNLLRSCSI
jgi:hypothetical protein